MSAKKPTDFFDADSLVFAAFRYYLGRMTISACGFAETLARAYPYLSESVQDIIAEELEDEFRRDDDARAKGKKTYFPLGMDCDREAWEKVRAAYKKETP